MKKIVLMMLVAMVPLLTMAQKRSKKGKNIKTEKIVKSNVSYDFMVITGYETAVEEVKGGVNGAASTRSIQKDMMKSNSKIVFNFDFGRVKTNELSNLRRNARNYRTIATAINAALNEGWNFVSSNVILSGKDKIHYFYMRKNK